MPLYVQADANEPETVVCAGRQPMIACHTVQLPRVVTPQADAPPDAGLMDPWKDSKAAEAATIYTLPSVGGSVPPPPPPRRGVANDQYKDKVSTPTQLPLMQVHSKCEVRVPVQTCFALLDCCV